MNCVFIDVRVLTLLVKLNNVKYSVVFVGKGLNFVLKTNTTFSLETRFLREKIDMDKVRFLMLEISAENGYFAQITSFF